ncbi:hypothetical protein KR215_007955 [Drosophila sulfurigaster]|nr:hypothetical protein KR215_007955 [Drosophila sulfurigaster]
MVFKLIKQAPLTEQVHSKDGCIYLYRAMKFIGWRPPKSGIWRYVYLTWTLTTFIWCTTYLPLGFLGSYMTQIKLFSPGEFLTSLQVCINAYGSSVKVAITYSQLWRLVKARDLLDKLDVRCTSDEEREKIHRVVARSNHAFLIFTFVYCGYAGSTYLSSVLSGRPPWQLYNPVIDWHDGTLKLYCALIRPVISGTIFTQFLLIGVVLGLTLINVFFFSDIWTGIASFMFVITILLQTFPFCYTCNLIMDDCAALSHTIFQSNWIDSGSRYQSTLLYFLHNVQQPIVFIAGGIFQISMSSNISVAKFAFSVITITKQMNIADKFKTD